MKKASKRVSPRKSNALRAILTGGLIAGSLDLAAACAMSYWRGISPIRVMQAIASGLLGAESYKGGAATAALGVLLHFLIAFGATVVFYLASRKLTFLVRHAFVSGLLFGALVYFFMELVVLPLSAFPHKNRLTPDQIAAGLIVHIFCVGLPIALAVRRFSKS